MVKPDKRSSQEQFDRQARHYNAQWNAWSGDSLRWLVERAQPRPSDDVLDVATGTGFTALAFGPLVRSVVGVDISEGMLAEARKKAQGMPNVTFQNAAAESLPFGDAHFDVVTCRVAPHHFESVPDFLAESYRVLRAGGRLLIADTTVPDDAPGIDEWQNRVEALRDPSHVRNHSPVEWRRFAEAAGFAVEDLHLHPESGRIALEPWIEKAGCKAAAADEVRQLFREASAEVRRTFAIEEIGGEWSFQWLRVALAARK
jgi:ubiquinone/menaquinone biosynthesis C-methylase UbiE